MYVLNSILISHNTEMCCNVVSAVLEASYKTAVNLASMLAQNFFIIHFINSPYNFSIQNCPQNSDRLQFWFQSTKCVL